MLNRFGQLVPDCGPTPCAPCPPGSPPGLPFVGIDLASLKRLVQELAVGPPLFMQPVPAQAPPRGAKTWARYSIVVVAPNAATGDAGAIAGSTILATSEGAARFATITEVTPGTVNEPAPVFAEQAADGQAIRVAAFGARVHSSMRPIRFGLLKGGTAVNEASATGSGIFEFSDFGDLDAPVPVYAEIQPREIVSIVARNLDVNSGYLVETLLLGWQYPFGSSAPSDLQAIQRLKDSCGNVR